MIKKSSKLFIIGMCMFLLTSCWDSKDVNKQSIDITTGMDYVNNNIELSGEVAKLVSSSESGEKAETAGVYKIFAYGKDFEEARVNYDALSPFPVFLGAARVVIFGEKYAKKGIESYLNRVDHLYDYRKTVLVVVSRETPRKLLNVKVGNDISVGFLIEDIMKHVTDKGEGLYPVTGQLLSDIELGKIGYVLPYVGIEEGVIKYLGLAVMKDSKLVGIIDIENTSGIMYILGEKPKIVQVVDINENNKISFRTIVKKRKIKADYMDDKVNINIDLDLKAQLRYQYYMKPLNDEDIKKLEVILSEKVKSDVKDTIKRAQNEFKCDIFGFARYFRAKEPEIYEKINWEDAFTKANITVNVKTKIINKGLTDPNAKRKY